MVELIASLGAKRFNEGLPSGRIGAACERKVVALPRKVLQDPSTSSMALAYKDPSLQNLRVSVNDPSCGMMAPATSAPAADFGLRMMFPPSDGESGKRGAPRLKRRDSE